MDRVLRAGEKGFWRALRGDEGPPAGRALVWAVGEEGGERPASDKAADGSFQNCSCSFSAFHL